MVIEVSAVAVVEGATVVIGPPSRLDRTGALAARVASWFQPNPSTTTSTTRSASWAAAGSQLGAVPAGWSSAGTTFETQAPS